MTMSVTEKLGFARQVAEYLQNNADALRAAGLDAQARLQNLQQKLNTAVTTGDAQEALKVKLKSQTEKATETLRDLYVTASGDLDAMMGLLKKDSSDAESLSRLRSRVRMGARAIKETPKAA